MKKFYIVYQITNKITNYIYIGCHITENINDKYFGSGTNIKKAIKSFGKENFEKIILFNFDSKKDMLNKERELVNDEFIKRGDTYNIILGGGYYSNNTITVKDKNGISLKVHKTDPRYLSGELVGITSGKTVIKNKYGIIKQIDVNDPLYLSNELMGIAKGKTVIIDKKGNIKQVDINDPKFLTGEYIHVSKDTIMVKDIKNNTICVSITDPRYLSGELKFVWCGKKHKLSTLQKMSNVKKGKYKGVDNSQFGTCWIYNLSLKINKKINLDEIDNYILDGWIKGRKLKWD
jgi:hypothetical protein